MPVVLKCVLVSCAMPWLGVTGLDIEEGMGLDSWLRLDCKSVAARSTGLCVKALLRGAGIAFGCCWFENFRTFSCCCAILELNNEFFYYNVLVAIDMHSTVHHT